MTSRSKYASIYGVVHEAIKSKIPRLHFKPEGWIEPSDPEFLDQFTAFLVSEGFNPQGLIFSGLDGTPVINGESLPRKKGIYAMNVAGWRSTFTQPGKHNPAMYADAYGIKCIGLYDRTQLAEAYLPKHARRDPIDEEYQDLVKPIDLVEPTISIDRLYDPPSTDVIDVGAERYEVPIDLIYRDEDFEIRDQDTSIEDALKGEDLVNLPLDYVIEEGVLHRNYPEDPDARPADALVGIVFFESFQPKRDRRGPRYRF